ncbi:hypothetical protein [Mesorhizobium sp. M1406]|uniref:hypothetical protein n=1 Tax=Mesorhizobium sp. M1406 TaxID=2957099 RepID=UPI0033352172
MGQTGSAAVPSRKRIRPVIRSTDFEWQTVGSLQRRLRNCMIGVRSEPFAFGTPEFVDLELYLIERARGLPVETPAVRP